MGGEEFAGAFLGGLAEFCPRRRILNQIFDGAHLFFNIAEGNKLAADLVFDDFGDAADGGRHAGAGEAHGFQDAEAEAFGLGGEQAEVGGLEIVFDVGNIFADDKAVFQAEATDFFYEGGKFSTGENEELEGFAGTDAGGNFEEEIDALRGTQVGGVEDECFVAQSQFFPDFVAAAAWEARFKEIVDDVDWAMKAENTLGFLF